MKPSPHAKPPPLLFPHQSCPVSKTQTSKGSRDSFTPWASYRDLNWIQTLALQFLISSPNLNKTFQPNWNQFSLNSQWISLSTFLSKLYLCHLSQRCCSAHNPTPRQIWSFRSRFPFGFSRTLLPFWRDSQLWDFTSFAQIWTLGSFASQSPTVTVGKFSWC
jgi:hypothetical protein